MATALILAAILVSGSIFAGIMWLVAIRRGWQPRRRRTPLTNALAPWVIGNFFLFAAISIIAGGDAINGSHSADGYFVSSHSNDTKVSRSFWNFSQFHGFLTIGSFIFLALVNLIERLALGTYDPEEVGSATDAQEPRT